MPSRRNCLWLCLGCCVAGVGAGVQRRRLDGSEDEIRGVFQNAQDTQPIIVILGDSSGSTTGTHTVAILNIVANSQEAAGETIIFYDPEGGEIREMSDRDFWSAWSLGGEYAFTIQP